MNIRNLLVAAVYSCSLQFSGGEGNEHQMAKRVPKTAIM